MVENKCWYQNQADIQGIDFFSIRNTSPNGVLVLNPEPTRQVLKSLTGSQESPTLETLEAICASCGLCKPIITETTMGNAFRIARFDYIVEEKEAPLVTITTFDATPPSSGYRLAVVDDYNPDSMGRYFAGRGFNILCAKVNPNVRPTMIGQRTLTRSIVEWQPDLVISDKGLGYMDGIALILACKEEGLRTMMYTGEVQTAETRKVADRFITKPTLPEELLEIVLQEVGADR